MKTFALAVLFALSAAPSRAIPPPFRREPAARPGYAARARKELDEIAVKIDALEARARDEGMEARQRMAIAVGSLRERKSEADLLLDRLEKSAGKARRELEIKMDRALRDLKSEYRATQSRPAGPSTPPADGGG